MESTEDIIKTIQHNGCTITLVGTAHVSHKSVALVEEKIRTGDYDCIAVELCPARHKNLVDSAWWKNLDIFQIGTFPSPSSACIKKFLFGRNSNFFPA